MQRSVSAILVGEFACLSRCVMLNLSFTINKHSCPVKKHALGILKIYTKLQIVNNPGEPEFLCHNKKYQNFLDLTDK